MAAGTKSKAKPRTKKPVEAELVLLSQQSSSDDGMAAALVQKIQSGMEKKKKDKETRYFQDYKRATQETNAQGTTEFMEQCAQIEKTFDDFTLAYAKAEDEIRAIWSKIVSAQTPFIAEGQRHLAAEIEYDKDREEQQVLGLAYHRKSEEAFARAISSLQVVDSESD